MTSTLMRRGGVGEGLGKSEMLSDLGGGGQ